MEVIRCLAQACPDVLEDQEKVGNGTALHDVCAFRMSGRGLGDELLEILALSERAVTAQDRLGQTPFHRMCYSGCFTSKSMQILLDKCPGLPSLPDGQGRIPLHSVLIGMGANVSRMDHYLETIQYLLKVFAAGVHVPDNDGTTPLVLACEKDVDLSVVYELLRIDPIVTINSLLSLGEERTSSIDSETRKRKWGA